MQCLRIQLYSTVISIKPEKIGNRLEFMLETLINTWLPDDEIKPKIIQIIVWFQMMSVTCIISNVQ